MNIAIDCADLDHSRIDGTRVYIKNLLEFFGKTDDQSQFSLYHQTNFNPHLEPSRYSNYADRKIPYSWWWTQTRFPYELIKDKPDVCFMPIHQIPYLAAGKVKFVVTIHDLAFKLFPSHFDTLDRLKLNLFTDFAIKKAERVIAVSHSTKRDIEKFYPFLNDDKISVIHHGFDHTLFSHRASKEEIEKVLRKYRIKDKPNQRYLFYVGAIQPRKDLITLVKAFEELKREREFSDLRLVLTGEPAWQAEKTLSYINQSDFSKEIILTGNVSFEDLPKIYQGAEIFVFPSLYEGFGMPVLEALASDVPVIVADNSSLREIGADAVETFVTGNAQSLATSLRKLIKSDNLKSALSSKGREHLKQFSWKSCAEKTLKVLHDCARPDKSI